MDQKPKLYLRHLAAPFQSYEVLKFDKDTKIAKLHRANPAHNWDTTFDSPITDATFKKYRYELVLVSADGTEKKLR